MTLRLVVSVLVAGLAALAPTPALEAGAAPAVVHAELFDFGIRLEPGTVRAGPVTFDVRNVSAGTVHEMIVVATRLAPDRLPYRPASKRVDERRLRSLGEVSGPPPRRRRPSDRAPPAGDLRAPV